MWIKLRQAHPQTPSGDDVIWVNLSTGFTMRTVISVAKPTTVIRSVAGGEVLVQESPETIISAMRTFGSKDVP